MNNVSITPFLWFNNDAEAAVELYLSVFPASRKLSEFRPDPNSPALTITIELAGQQIVILNATRPSTFTDAISLTVHCDTQDEIDHYWNGLTAGGGTPVQCGWLRDRFGLSWQITPRRIGEWIRHPRAMQAMMSMQKLDIAALQAAAMPN